jgi:hypothetical protein
LNIYCDYETGEGLVDALMKLTLLEELEIHFKYTIDAVWVENMLQCFCQACPHLNKLVLMFAWTFDLECN